MAKYFILLPQNAVPLILKDTNFNNFSFAEFVNWENLKYDFILVGNERNIENIILGKPDVGKPVKECIDGYRR